MRSNGSTSRLEGRFLDLQTVARAVVFWAVANLGIISSFAQPGSALWTNYYDGTAHGSDKGYAVCVDGSDKVYVTGSSPASDGRAECATVAYTSAGAFLWANRYSEGYGNEYPKAVVGGFSNIYVTGFSWGLASSYDFATLAYSDAGIPLWTNRYSGPESRFDWAWDAAWDPHNGNLYVTGFSADAVTDDDFLTVAYASTGVALWTNRFGGGGRDSAMAVAVGPNGIVFITGTGNRCTTVAYSATGVCLWTNFYRGGDFTDESDALAVDKDGNVYVAGSSLSADTAWDWFIVGYTSAGVALWTNRYDGPVSGDDFVSAVAVDNNGHVYVTGTSAGMTSPDYLTIAYSSSGNGLWTNRYEGPGFDFDEAHAMAVDSNGNVYVTGTSFGNNQLDYATIGYSSAGIPLWTNRFNGSVVDDAEANSITLDNVGNVLVTGYATGPHGTPDFATIKYAGQALSQTPIPIEIQRLSNGVRLTWTNSAFNLQSAPSLNGTFTNVPNAVSPYTNSITGSQKFFRLSL